MTAKTESESRVTMICPNLTCRRTLSAPVSARGKIMRCVYCNVPFRVPENATDGFNGGSKGTKGKKH